MRWKNYDTLNKATESFYGKTAILETWERMAPKAIANKEHDYILELRARIRVARNRIVYATRNTPLRIEKAAQILDEDTNE